MREVSDMRRYVLITSLFVLSGVSLSQEVPNFTYKPEPQVIRDVMLPPSRFAKLLVDLFEYKLNSDEKELKYDTEFWFGGDFNRIWIELEGEHALSSGDGALERADIYYSRLITPFFDFRVGVGTQVEYGREDANRAYGVIGIQGLAPYWFEVDANLRMDTKGKVTADLEAEIDFLFTQRLILQPRFETLVSFGDIEDVGIGSGLNYTELGLRLRYEFRREFAPYIGVNWVKFYGNTKDILEKEGKDTDSLSLILGLRVWF